MIRGMEFDLTDDLKYTLVKSERKSVSIQIKPDGQIVVRAPKRMSVRDIHKLVREKESWIRRHMDAVAEQTEEAVDYLTREEIQTLANQALKVIPERVRFYAPKVGVTYGRITIRNQKTRWGSCSSKGNLNFNCLLMLTPKEVIDSVVVHELCHRKEMNHSKKFYDEVYRVFPEYDKWDKWLKQNGKNLIRRMQ